MADITQLEAFVAVVEEGSLTAAARRTGRSLQAVSRSLQMLERSTGTALVVRTTRKLRVTDPGRRFYEQLKVALAQIELAQAELSDDAQRLEGRLRIAAPTLFGPRYVAPVAAEFRQRHPDVTVSLLLDDQFADPVTSGADVTVRLGDASESLLAGKRLASVRRVAFATPAYLAAHGRPKRPTDLLHHECVVRTGASSSHRWSFNSARNAPCLVAVKGSFESNNVAGVNAGVLAGMGIGLAAYWQVKEWLDAGRVELVLPEFEPHPLPLHALWAPNRKLPARVRLFVDMLAARLSREML